MHSEKTRTAASNTTVCKNSITHTNTPSFYMTCKLSVSIWKALFDNGRDCSSVQIERFIRSWCARPNGPKYTNGQPHLLSAIYYFPSSPLLLCTTPSINRNLKKLSPTLLLCPTEILAIAKRIWLRKKKKQQVVTYNANKALSSKVEMFDSHYAGGDTTRLCHV